MPIQRRVVLVQNLLPQKEGKSFSCFSAGFANFQNFVFAAEFSGHFIGLFLEFVCGILFCKVQKCIFMLFILLEG